MIDLYKPFMPALQNLDEVLHSGKLAYGKYGRDFEDLLRSYFNTEYLITTNTFNFAMLVALTTLGLKNGDKVIVSPMACLASTQPLASYGLKIVWADVNPKTGTLCPKSVRSLMNQNPKLIVHNHFCGQVGFIDEINDIGKEFGVLVIDDSIEAFGSTYKGEKVGSVGTDVTIFSFSPVRFPNTIDGGAILFKDQNLFEKSILVRDAGINRDLFRDEMGEINPNCDIQVVGHSATMDEIKSYIGLQQMKHVDYVLDRQRENAKYLKRVLEKNKEIIPISFDHYVSNYWVFGVLAKDKKNMIIKLRESGVYASGVHINNNIYSVFGDDRNLPGVSEFMSKFIALPSGWWVDYQNSENVLEIEELLTNSCGVKRG